MTADKRKSLRALVQAHPAITPLRKQIAEALTKFPALSPAHAEKLAALTRLFLGGKMPTRVVMLQRGSYAVRSCVSGVVFTAAVFQSLGGRENQKLVAPMTRLADAVSYHFRSSRLRGGVVYNFNEAQAKEDAEFLQPQLEALAKLLIECGVPVMGNPISSIPWAPCEVDSTKAGLATIGQYEQVQEELSALKCYVETIETRLAALESNAKLKEVSEVCEMPGHICVPETPKRLYHKTVEKANGPVGIIGIPSSF